MIRTEKNKPPVFYLIDLHSIRIKREVTIHNRINNLVQLNNFRISMVDRLRFVKAYLQEGGLKGVSTEDLIRKIASVSSTHWHHLWRKRKRKCLRPRKEVEGWKVDSWTGMVRKAYGSSLSQVFERMDVNFQGTGSKNIKKTSRSSVKEIVLSPERKSQSLIVKEYKSINLLSRLKAVFRISKARRAWINAHNLLMRGISTPVPVAFGEKKRWGIIRESFFITEKIPEAEASDFYLKELSGNLRDLKKEFLIRLARQIRWMHQTGICHGDLKASNILVTILEEKPVIFLVDPDGVKIRNKLGVKEIAKDLSRLRAAFSGILSQSEHEYFLAIYGRGNRFFQDNEKKIMKKVRALTDKKIQQKQKNKVSIHRKDAEDAKGR
ncbi:MAG: hypothetical protein JRJ08_00380 [Deltaproteobacteria bacterium]|nr:hypothetical protein [Deltaproteobacteria bacterium]